MTPHGGRGRSVSALVVTVLAVATFALTTPAPPTAADSNEAPNGAGGYRSITAGSSHTCVRLGSGDVKCWGSGADWRLGYSDAAMPSGANRGDKPHQMGADLETIVLGAGRTAHELSAGVMHTCAVLDDATVKCWGKSTSGQLGQGSIFALPPGDSLPPVALGTGRTATRVMTGTSHTCAILDDATLKCWGANNVGQLGLGDIANRGDGVGEMGDNLPTVDLGTGRTAEAVAGGISHTCALLDNGTIKCWGANDLGQLGLGDEVQRGDAAGEMGDNLPPVDLGTGRTATALTAGADHSCALLDNGAVKCWGANNLGQLGLGDTVDRGNAANEMGDDLPAVDLGTGRTATAVSASSNGRHTCAALDNGAVKCWGANNLGQLGLGDTVDRGNAANEMGDDLPAVDLGTGRTAVIVTAGGFHNCAALDDASLKCWGYNSSGQLGLSDSANRGDAAGEMGDSLPTVPLTGSGIAGRVHLTGASDHGHEGLVAVLRADDHTLAGADATSNYGTFSIAVPPGDYRIYVIDSTGSYTSGFHGAPDIVTVTDGQLTTANPVLAPSLGSITGTVTETGTGTPLAGITVLRFDATMTTIEAKTTTDGAGQYAFSGLRPGSRIIAFLDPTGAHQVRFHANAAAPQDATPVSVTGGGTAVADGTLPTQPVPVTTAAITGSVKAVGGGEWSSSSLPMVIALRASDHAFVRATTASSSGTYTLLVPQGSYKLLFVRGERHAAEWYDNQPSAALGSATTVPAPGVASATLSATFGRLALTLAETGGGSPQHDWVVLLGPNGVERATLFDACCGGSNIQLNDIPIGNYRLLLVDPNGPVLEFYADAPDYAGAAAFAITPGGTTDLTATLGP